MIHHGAMGLEDFAGTVKQTTRILKANKSSFTSIVVCGNSGLIVGSPVSLALKVPLLIVRKRYDRHHGIVKVINSMRCGDRWLFLDDFIDEGVTFNWVMQKMRERYSNPVYGDIKCAGSYLYGEENLELYQEN